MSFAVLDAGRSLGLREVRRINLCCIWHEKPKIELSPSMNSGFPELLALLCFLSFPISEFRSFCSKCLRLYRTACRIKSCFTRSYISYTSSFIYMPETSPVL
ncbi:unnamed protein product (mitochondrion) [Musa acuminata var. zebrina]